MNREIKFRGKDILHKSWQYGSLAKDEPQKSYYIIDNEYGRGIDVDKETVNKIAICPLCGCEFEYDNNDAKIEKAFYFTLFPLQYKTYIKCPECNKEICLGTKNY